MVRSCERLSSSGLELAPRRGVAFAPEGDRDLPDAFDRREDGFALLLPDGVAEHAPDQPDVVPQCPFAIGKFENVHAAPRPVAPRRTKPLKLGLQEARLMGGGEAALNPSNA